MSGKYLTTFAIILFNLHYSTSLADDCSVRVAQLDEKLNRVLYILESTFKVPATKINGKSSDYYGVPLTNSGKSNVYSPKSRGGSSIIGGKGSLGGGKGYVGVGDSLNSLKGLKNQYKPKKKDDLHGGGIEKGGFRDKNIKDNVMYDTDKEIKTKGYSDQDAYLGATEYNSDQGAFEGYDKNEAYLTAQGDGFVHESEYEGVRVNDSINALRRNIVREEQEINEDFFTDYSKENHAGDYTGGEFDVGYKAKETNGGFSDKQAKTELQQSKYIDASKKGDNYLEGKDYNKDAYTRDEDDKDKYYRDTGIYGAGKGNKGGNYYDEPALYDKYTGKKGKGNAYQPGTGVGLSGKGGKVGHGGGLGLGYAVERTDRDQESDIDKRFKGNEFGVNDKYGASIKADDNIGVKQALATEQQYNNGKYTDVAAKGHNKAANYKGDYKTQKEARKSGYKFQNLESVEEIGTPDRFASVIVNDNRQVFKGKERKSSINEDKKYGKYTDRERNKKQDKKRNAAAYVDQGFYNKIEQDKENDSYLGAKNHRDYKTGDYKKGYGDYQPKKKRDNYNYYNPQQSRDDDSRDSRRPRQRRY